MYVLFMKRYSSLSERKSDFRGLWILPHENLREFKNIVESTQNLEFTCVNVVVRYKYFWRSQNRKLEVMHI